MIGIALDLLANLEAYVTVFVGPEAILDILHGPHRPFPLWGSSARLFPQRTL